MMEDKEKTATLEVLRKKAGQVLESQPGSLGGLSPDGVRQLIAELLAHLSDLEVQSDERDRLGVRCKQLEGELRKTAEESRQRHETISALLESARAILHQRDFETAARSIFDSCKQLIGATAGYVALLSADGSENEVLFLDTGGAACSVDPSLPMPIRGMREEVFRTSQTAYENDFPASEWVEFIPTGHSGIDNVLFAPLLIKGITVGLLGLANKPGGFSDSDASMASVFGELAAIALLNSRAIESLQDSEERFRSVAQTASDAIIVIDSLGSIVFWNKAATDIFGYTQGETMGQPVSLIMPRRYRGDHHKGIERVVSTGVSKIIGKTVEMTGRKKDGGEFPVELSLSSWRSKGEIFFSGVIRDISERKRAEEEIQGLARFPSENLNPVLRVSKDGTVLYANKASAPLLAVWDSQVDQRLPEPWGQRVTDVIASAESCTIEVSGDERIFSIDLAPVVEMGYVNFYGRDVTNLKRAEALLKEQNQFITTVFESLRDPFYVVDANDYTIKMANSATYRSDTPYTACCYELAHGRSTPCHGVGYLCPLEEIKKTKKPVVTEHIHYGEDNITRIFEVHAHPIFDDQGEVVQVIEYTLDITDRKQMEAALRESEAKWRSLTEDSPDHVITLDKELNIQFLNYASPGLTVEELIGTPIVNYLAEEKRAEIKAILENVLITGEPDSYETEYITPDGSTIYYESRAVPRVLAGEVVGLTLDARDITGRRQMEDALRERTFALGERIKELNCLYGISALVEKPGISLQEILEGTVELIPPAWQYPEIAGARIILEGQEIRTGNYSEASSCRQVADILVQGQRKGSVEVCYLEERAESNEGPFLDEERELIKAIAEELGRIITKVQAEEALQRAHDTLEARVRERTAELVVTNLMLQDEIAERKRAYEAEQYARQVSETLRSASQELVRTLDLDTVLHTLLDYLGRMVHFDQANIALLGDESYLVVRAVRGYQGGMRDDPAHLQGYPVEDALHVQEILATGKSILISDTRQQPGWKAYPGEGAVNWLGVPIVAEDRVIGLCSLGKSEAGFFTQEHLGLAEALVGQAAVAIQNAWLFEQVRAGRKRLQSLSRGLVEAQENERRYIARELHDEAGQALTSLKVGLRLLERDAQHPESVVAGVAELNHMADNILENLHRLAMDLRPASLDHLGLVAALRQYVESVSDQHGLTLQFESTGFEERLPLDVETALYRIVQEAMTNVIRHAQATRADVIIERRNDKLIVIIEDNGIGFDRDIMVESDRLGIVGMRERAEMLGGEFYIEHTPGSGTTVFVEVPYDPAHTHRG